MEIESIVDQIQTMDVDTVAKVFSAAKDRINALEQEKRHIAVIKLLRSEAKALADLEKDSWLKCGRVISREFGYESALVNEALGKPLCDYMTDAHFGITFYIDEDEDYMHGV